MEYEIGKAGRVVVMRLRDGDPIYASIESAAKKEKINSAAVWPASRTPAEITGVSCRRVAEAKCGLELPSITAGAKKS